VRLHLGKQWEVARGGLLDCFIYDPYAKVVKAQSFVSGAVVMCRDSVGRKRGWFWAKKKVWHWASIKAVLGIICDTKIEGLGGI
jgi:hypothetical protein